MGEQFHSHIDQGGVQGLHRESTILRRQPYHDIIGLHRQGSRLQAKQEIGGNISLNTQVKILVWSPKVKPMPNSNVSPRAQKIGLPSREMREVNSPLRDVSYQIEEWSEERRDEVK
ncbi:hypothetical protein CK203_005839 [Vitis vinifera]|uniref:Uncharacterized protein n=1 Tax=Vitis vinifera TaxID=29760 RepID=A0A438K4F5_VITVI|nr:hypothetical protein CK203_005839 [Vitis vinifera]